MAPVNVVGPLKLVSFKGALTAEGSNLNWVSANEVNMKNFVVERSKDGRSYSALGTVEAKNRSEATYAFLDKAPFDGVNYYRLKMTNTDGSFTYSNIATINNRRSIQAEVFPNPAINSITVSHGKAVKGASIVITNTAGVQVKSYTVLPGAIQSNIAIDQLQRGNYVVIYQNDGERSVTKFVKQ